MTKETKRKTIKCVILTIIGVACVLLPYVVISRVTEKFEKPYLLLFVGGWATAMVVDSIWKSIKKEKKENNE